MTATVALLLLLLVLNIIQVFSWQAEKPLAAFATRRVKLFDLAGGASVNVDPVVQSRGRGSEDDDEDDDEEEDADDDQDDDDEDDSVFVTESKVTTATPEIEARLEAEKDNLLRLRLNHAVSAIESPSEIKRLRRTIARLNTILRQREMAEQSKQ